MPCGVHLGELFYLADRLLERSDVPGPSSPAAWPAALPASGTAWLPPPPGRPAADVLRTQLYEMYGEGQISEAVFTALRPLAEWGQLRPADLAVHRVRAQRRGRGGDTDLANALQGVRSRLAQLAQTRAASERVLADLEARRADLDQRVTGKEQAARDALGHDEQAARQRLLEKAELAGSRERVAAQASALQGDLARLADLQAQLDAKLVELEAVQARKRLAEEMLK
jgi:hypothetical protein